MLVALLLEFGNLCNMLLYLCIYLWVLTVNTRLLFTSTVLLVSYTIHHVKYYSILRYIHSLGILSSTSGFHYHNTIFNTVLHIVNGQSTNATRIFPIFSTQIVIVVATQVYYIRYVCCLESAFGPRMVRLPRIFEICIAYLHS